jgi:pyruvate formate lyase activating enzyme
MITVDAPSAVYGVLKNPSLVDFRGHYAGVFFISGCNYQCGFCHNAELMNVKPGMTWKHLRSVCERFREQWVDGVVITGGEPTISPELPKVVDFMRKEGFAVKLDTNGSRPDVVEQVLPQVDYVAMDVKCSLSNYPELTGFKHTDRVARSIELIKSRAPDYEFRTTILDYLHTEEEMHRIGALIKGARRYVIQPFLPREDLPGERFRTMPRTPPDLLKRWQALMKDYAEEVILIGAV